MNADPRQDRERVLGATDIADLIGDYLALTPRGREYVGLCPFHDDHKPSMSVVPHKSMFHCFACGAGGNAIDFVMRYHGIEFREALEQLAQRAGIELTPMRRGQGVRRSATQGVDRAALAEATRFAHSYFRSILTHTDHGREARAMLEARGISAEMVERFGIGASADRWDGLGEIVARKGHDARAFVEAGLLKQRDSGGAYDAFRHRLIFPITDLTGQPIGFGGRRLREDDEPKYVNSAESTLFDKGSSLFGQGQAQRSIASRGEAIIVEGYTDVIACHQAGITNAVASLGTAFTPAHAKLLRRIAQRVVLLFDGDEAGQRAAERAVEVFFAEPVEVAVLTLPGGQDPDDFLRSPEGGAERFRTLIAQAPDALAYLIDRRVGAAGSTAQRAEAARTLLLRFVDLGLRELPPIRRQGLLHRLGSASGLHEAGVSALSEELRAARPRRRSVEGGVAAETVEAFVPSDGREHALACVLACPGLVRGEPDFERLAGVIDPQRFERARPSRIARIVLDLAAHGPSSPARAWSLGDVLAALESSEDRAAAAALAAWAEREVGESEDALAEHWRECVVRLGARPVAEAQAKPAQSFADRLAALREQHESLGQLASSSLPRPVNPL